MTYTPTLAALHICFETGHTPAPDYREMTARLKALPTDIPYFHYPILFLHINKHYRKLMRQTPAASARHFLLDALNGKADSPIMQAACLIRESYIQRLDKTIASATRRDLLNPHIYDEALDERVIATHLFTSNKAALTVDEFNQLYDLADHIDKNNTPTPQKKIPRKGGGVYEVS